MQIFASVLAFIVLASALPAQAEKLYKWVDDNGIIHYGDFVPASDARRERAVLNEQGVEVEVLPRQKNAEELAQEAARKRDRMAQEEREARARERDRILLDTYLSIEEIADLRDRRILALEAQIGVTRHYINNLQSKWDDLEADARQYNFPYEEASELPALPDDIAQHLIHTEKAMAEHMLTVQSLKSEQSQIRNNFARDMDRFKELTADENIKRSSVGQL